LHRKKSATEPSRAAISLLGHCFMPHLALCAVYIHSDWKSLNQTPNHIGPLLDI